MTVKFDYDFQSHSFESPGYLTCIVPDCVRHELEKIIEDVKKNSQNYKDSRKSLAGHLEKEYKLPITSHIKYLVETLSIEYDKIYNGGKPYQPILRQYHSDVEGKAINYNYELKSIWINFSKKYDFNPVHSHSGAFSFVIWVDIPYDLDEEFSRYSPNGNETTLFGFYYCDSLGNMSKKLLDIDKSWEWKMAFFPASLSHSVNPFYTSDEYRISIAGNVFCVVETNEIS
jgi:hypothetical protein